MVGRTRQRSLSGEDICLDICFQIFSYILVMLDISVEIGPLAELGKETVHEKLSVRTKQTGIWPRPDKMIHLEAPQLLITFRHDKTQHKQPHHHYGCHDYQQQQQQHIKHRHKSINWEATGTCMEHTRTPIYMLSWVFVIPCPLDHSIHSFVYYSNLLSTSARATHQIDWTCICACRQT